MDSGNNQESQPNEHDSNKPTESETPTGELVANIPEFVNAENIETVDENMENERLQLLACFPEEIWELVAEMDAEAAEKLSNSSRYLRNLFLSERTVFLFRKVWDIMSTNIDWKHFCMHNLNGERTKCDSCERRKYPCYTEIFAVRSVCKKWAHAVDNSDILPRICSAAFAIQNKSVYEFNIRDEKMYNTARDFLDHFKSTHGNGANSRSPFIGNSVRVIYNGFDYAESDRLLFEKVFEIFSTYGHHVRHIYIEEDVKLMYLAGYIKLQTILQTMPNLESLEISHVLYGTDRKIHPVPMKRQATRLNQHMASNPLPTLKHLQSIKLAGNGSVLCILYELIQKNNHISKLGISNLSIAECDILTTPLPNMRELSLELFSNDDLQALTDARLNWPLAKLAIDIFILSELVNWYQFFALLQEKWSSTLLELKLRLPALKAGKSYSPEDDVPTSLYLQNIRCLELTFCYFTSIDFILPLKDTLEHLTVEESINIVEFRNIKTFGEAAESNTIIKFWSYFGDFLKSNVWIHFPKLKDIRFISRSMMKEEVFSRKEWLVRNMQQE